MFNSLLGKSALFTPTNGLVPSRVLPTINFTKKYVRGKLYAPEDLFFPGIVQPDQYFYMAFYPAGYFTFILLGSYESIPLVQIPFTMDNNANQFELFSAEILSDTRSDYASPGVIIGGGGGLPLNLGPGGNIDLGGHESRSADSELNMYLYATYRVGIRQVSIPSRLAYYTFTINLESTVIEE
jgi:hypothetical protein